MNFVLQKICYYEKLLVPLVFYIQKNCSYEKLLLSFVFYKLRLQAYSVRRQKADKRSQKILIFGRLFFFRQKKAFEILNVCWD